MKDFRELNVWKKSRFLLTDVLKITETFPENRESELRHNMQNSCVDILANLTKGFSSHNAEQLPQYLQVSLVSINRLEHHFQKAYDLRFMDSLEYHYLQHEIKEIMKMLHSFIFLEEHIN